MEFQSFDAAYLERVRAGDPATNRHFLDYFGELLRIKLRSRLRSPEAIEDVRQETFARFFNLLRSESGIHHPERLGPLINSICNNVLFEYRRSESRADPMDDELADRMMSQGPDALNMAISQETRENVRQVLKTLNARDRRVLQGIFLEERDKDELCAELGVSREYVRVLLHRAKQAFRANYSKRTNPARGLSRYL